MQSDKALSAGEMQRRIEELLLQAEFTATISTLSDPKRVCAAACSWLEEVLKWEVFSVSCMEGELGQYQYQVLYLDQHLSQLCPDAAATSAATPWTGTADPNWRDPVNDAVSIPFPDCSGVLTVSRDSLLENHCSDEFLTGVAESLSRALSNAREYHRLKTLSMHDHLTGLYNRRIFETMLKLEASKRSVKPFSLLLIDLDNFKTINDTYGHRVGDEVLVYVADMLRLNFRKADIAARYGGDEFGVLLPETSLAAAQRIAERFRDSVAAGGAGLGCRNIVPTVSVGIAAVTDRSGMDMARVVEEADRALYRAKAPGKNRVCASLVR